MSNPAYNAARAEAHASPERLVLTDAERAALRAKAVRGDVRAAEVLLDRAFGKAGQTIDVTTNGQPITPPIVWADQLATGSGS